MMPVLEIFSLREQAVAEHGGICADHGADAGNEVKLIEQEVDDHTGQREQDRAEHAEQDVFLRLDFGRTCGDIGLHIHLFSSLFLENQTRGVRIPRLSWITWRGQAMAQAPQDRQRSE